MKFLTSITKSNNFFNHNNLPLIILLSFVISISSFHFEKTLDWYGLVLYFFMLSLFFLLLLRYKRDVLSIITKCKPNRLIVVLLIGLVLSFVFWYPYESIRSIGTDRDEALNQSVCALLRFEYPYYERTIVSGKAHDLGLDNNPITVLPGSIIFAMPFVILGNSAYQNFFWILMLYWFLKVNLNSHSKAFLFLIIFILGTPTFLFQILIGSDYVANSLWILILIYSLLKCINNNQSFLVYLFSFALGIGMSSRFHFTLILIPLFFYLLINKPGRGFLAIRAIATVSISFVLITLPFFLYDIKNFTPIHYSNPFNSYSQQFPLIQYIVPSITIFVPFILLYTVNLNKDRLMMIMGLVVFIPTFCLIGIQFLTSGYLSFNSSHYFLPFSLYTGLGLLKNAFRIETLTEDP